MDKLIAEICSHSSFKNTRWNVIVYNFIGFIVVAIVFMVTVCVLTNMHTTAKVIGVGADNFTRIYTIDKIIELIICIATIYCLIYGLKYEIILIIEAIKIWRLPKLNDEKHSIEALMTPLVDDSISLHYEILGYLIKNKTAKDFALVFTWLFENSYIYTKEQKAFLEALATDGKIISVPAASSFNVAVVDVAELLQKDEKSLPSESYSYVKHYKSFEKILGQYGTKS